VVRKCLNGTAANNADFRITAKEGICGNEHMAGSVVDHNVTENVYLRRKGYTMG